MLKTTSSVISASQIATPITLPGNVTLSTGNLVIGTAGKGIDFSADPSAPGMTSELLDDYEEGTFTPTVNGLTVVGSAAYYGYYRKIGNLVYITILIAPSGGSTTSATKLTTSITGLPFIIAASTNCVVTDYSANDIGVGLAVPNDTLYVPSWTPRADVVVVSSTYLVN